LSSEGDENAKKTKGGDRCESHKRKILKKKKGPTGTKEGMIRITGDSKKGWVGDSEGKNSRPNSGT